MGQIVEIISKVSLENQKVAKEKIELKGHVKNTKTRIKRDALWKPILRKFRQFVRQLLQDADLQTGCHYWSFSRMFSKVQQLTRVIGFSDKKNESVYAMILLIFPTMATKTKN